MNDLNKKIILGLLMSLILITAGMTAVYAADEANPETIISAVEYDEEIAKAADVDITEATTSPQTESLEADATATVIADSRFPDIAELIILISIAVIIPVVTIIIWKKLK